MAKLSLIFVALVLAGVATASLRRVCYYTNWAQYRNGPGKFYPENVDPSLCTHIIYAFAKLIGNHLAAFEWNDESTPWMKGMYERFGAIKQQNPSVKTLLAVGGWNMGSPPFTHMVATDASRREFATTTVDFLRKNNFDGIDMDWEYPANRGSPPEDRHKFTLLLQALHDEFAKENIPAGKERLLISAAVAAGKEKIDTAYEIPEISRLLDFINLMTYDLHGSWETHTGHNAPLYSRTGETGNDTTLNVDWAAQEWVRKGAPREKLNIGLGLYGRSFKLPWNPTNTNMGCPASGAGAAGQYTGEAGFLAYYEICDKLSRGATRKYEPEQKVPYMVDNDLWVGYDDPDSLKVKVDYIKAEHFGGIMVWALDLDDFSGLCGQGKYPLMRSIINELNANSPVQPVFNPTTTKLAPVITHAPVTAQAAWTTRAPVPTQAPMPTTTQAPQPTTTAGQMTTTQPTTTHAPTTKAPSNNHHHQLVPIYNNELDCAIRSDGYYASPYDCSQYYICMAGMGYRTDCQPGLLFNDQTLYCDFQDHVTCSAGGGVPPVVQNPTHGQQALDTTTTRTTRPTTTTHAPTTTTKRAPIQSVSGPVNPANYCQGKPDGFYKDPMDCSHFYQCSFEVSYHEPCPSGTYFSEALQGCDWAANVPNCP